jgi:hypothetical protein
MEHVPNKSKATGSNPTVVHFYYLMYFSDLCFLLTRIIIGLAFRNLYAVLKRLTFKRMADLQDWVPCSSLAPQMSDRNTLEGPVLKFPRYTGDAPWILEALFFLSSIG